MTPKIYFDRESMQATAKRLHDKYGYVVLMISDHKYAVSCLNWMDLAKEHREYPILLVATDPECKKVFDAVADRPNCEVFEAQWNSMKQRHLWALRTQITHHLVQSGFETLVVDADALFRADPIPYLDKFKDADVVASTGTISPPRALKHQGFVLCNGFILYRNTPAALTLLDRLATKAQHINKFDDQAALNMTLINSSIEWNTKGLFWYRIPGRKPFTCYTEPVVGKAAEDNLTVVMLPHRLFQRVKNSIEMSKPYVTHWR